MHLIKSGKILVIVYHIRKTVIKIGSYEISCILVL